MRVGYILGSLNGDGAPWKYYKRLIKNVSSESDITPIGIYTGGNPAQFDIDIKFVKMDGLLPNWHSLTASNDIDLIHLNGLPVYGNIIALRCQVPVVATNHGTLHWATELPDDILPPWSYSQRKRIGDRISKYTVDKAFAVSHSTKQVLQTRAKWPERKISATYEPIDDAFFEQEPDYTSKWSDHSYMLHVSAAAPKKNVHRLLDAYAQYYDQAPDPLELVIAGPGWDDAIASAQSRHDFGGAVTYTGYIPMKELIALYDNTELFVFPSLHETFGLPNIEAMARGAPVLTTRQYGIPDVVGDAAAFIESPKNTNSIATALQNVAHDTSQLADLTNKGQQRANLYTWQRHYQILNEEYELMVHNEKTKHFK